MWPSKSENLKKCEGNFRFAQVRVFFSCIYCERSSPRHQIFWEGGLASCLTIGRLHHVLTAPFNVLVERVFFLLEGKCIDY